MIKAVIFDLGGVIVPLDFDRGYDRLASRCSRTVQEIRAAIGATDLVERFECGAIAPRDFARELSAAVGLSGCGYEDFCDLWSSIFLPHTLIPESLLASLRGRYRLLLLSNTNAIHFAMIRANYPLLEHFDELVLSYEVGAMKPSPAIYEAAVERAGCLPGECFFADDIPAYVEGARRAGIDAVRFESSAQVVRELTLRGIAV